jgi:ribonucleotide reductase alpha subunit
LFFHCSCQGLADAFILMRFPFESAEAQLLNKHIFETMYYAALSASKDLAKVEGPYDSYTGSPASKGQLQFDLWGEKDNSRLCERKRCVTGFVRSVIIRLPVVLVVHLCRHQARLRPLGLGFAQS